MVAETPLLKVPTTYNHTKEPQNHEQTRMAGVGMTTLTYTRYFPSNVELDNFFLHIHFVNYKQTSRNFIISIV